MWKYPDFVQGIVGDSSLLKKLRPAESSDPLATIRIREATDNALSDGKEIVDASLFPLIRGGLFYAVDAIEESYRIARHVREDTGVYWQGMIHRRLGDFDNARQCFRRIGSLSVFGELHRAAASVSPDMAKQSNWSPYLFVGMCEQEKFGASRHRRELLQLQRIEFDAMFDNVWRKSISSISE